MPGWGALVVKLVCVVHLFFCAFRLSWRAASACEVATTRREKNGLGMAVLIMRRASAFPLFRCSHNSEYETVINSEEENRQALDFVSRHYLYIPFLLQTTSGLKISY